MKRGDKLTTVELNFDGSSPSNKQGGETENVDPKAEAIARAKEAAKQRVQNTSQNSRDVAEEVRAEEKPEGKGITWNPNSVWAGPGRVLQALPPVRKAVEKFVSAGRQYSDVDDIKYPKIKLKKDYIFDLQRDQLIADGYLKELNLLENNKSNSKEYINAKKTIDEHLKTIQRDGKHNLKGDRSILLKKLYHPKEDKMYSSLNLLYFYCDRLTSTSDNNE